MEQDLLRGGGVVGEGALSTELSLEPTHIASMGLHVYLYMRMCVCVCVCVYVCVCVCVCMYVVCACICRKLLRMGGTLISYH